MLKTTGSGFEGFFRDDLTTLPETADRVLATLVTATWRRAPEEVASGAAWGALWRGVRRRLVETFAGPDSRSVHQTLYAMGEAVLAAHSEVDEIRLVLPNRHHLLTDLAPFDLDNPNLVFTPTDEPYGLIEGTVRRR